MLSDPCKTQDLYFNLIEKKKTSELHMCDFVVSSYYGLSPINTFYVIFIYLNNIQKKKNVQT